MAGVLLQPPLGEPMQYDPSFKVEVCLHEPLWGSDHDTLDIALQVTSLCAQIDLLCRKELLERPNSRIDNGNVSSAFETKASVLLDRAKGLLTKLPPPAPDLLEYLEYTGIGKLYPRAAAYITRPRDLSLALKRTSMDGYHQQLSALHQITTLAHQINSDIISLANHKYIAHQVALLYQSFNLLGDSEFAKIVKSNIEENFREVKDALSQDQEDGQEPHLQEDHAQWLLDVTTYIVNQLTAFPASLTKEMFPAAQVVSQFS